jgi:geranylgeranyl pyrophosphate synthase
VNKSSYFEEMRRISTLTWPLIERATASVFPSPSSYTSPRLLAVLELRRERPLFKPFLVYLSSTCCRSTRPRNQLAATLHLAAAAELINIASYQCNSALDEKNGVFSEMEKDEQQLAAALSREAATQLSLEPAVSPSINAAQLLGEAYSSIARGQLLDLFDLTLARLNALGDFDRFLSRYLLRCELLSGVFTGNCALLGARAGGSPVSEQLLLAEFGMNLGIAMQIANDIGDLLPPSAGASVKRPYQDLFSDLRNGRLTLPIYLLLRHSRPAERRLLRSVGEALHERPPRLTDLEAVARLFASSPAWDEARATARMFARRAKAALHRLPNSPSTPYLSCMASIVKTNKYNHRFAQLRCDLVAAAAQGAGAC